ncbi:cytochrome P450 [Conidiobolus coronatus NRRL 28638]|uniref:Cytochrome P450 n=1 Tax=Conidiobolus coronatus (strain ATCC 28846 / CBS 209.66 / NRRL 28638) TaxID=796925 RepID=A0A137PIU4_CONC2|nr:cytochrome P450 [Conidiobolus coronatus NRRL 28638]|eukprot:KXN74928.1 cytochrome P450 [Conidiobolus coronatus NRRL 28638]
MIQLLIILGCITAFLAYLFKVPKHLQSFPRVSFFGLVNTIFTGRSLDEHYKKVLDPALKEKGYAAQFWLGKWNVVVTQPQIAKQFFRNTTTFHKELPNIHGLFGKFLGKSNIFFSNGEDWRRHRKPANPIFHQTFHPEQFASSIEDTFEELMERINQSPDEALPVTDLMGLMTLDVLGKGIFSVDFEAVKSKGSSRYHHLYTSIINQIPNPVYFFFQFLHRYPMGKMAEAHKNIGEFKEFTMKMIQQRRKDLKDHKFEDSKDLLTTLLKETELNQEDPLTDEELVHNLNVFFIAGHDTTASSLSYGMYHLAKNQEVQKKLRKEIYEVLEISPETKKLKSMEYLGLVIKETMRISPPVGLLNRALADDYTIPGDSVVIPKGTVVGISIYAVHNDPKNFKNPEKFEPERFLNAKYDTNVYMPFGGGSRMCIGTNFSLIEQKVYLSMLVQKFILNIKKTNPDYENLRIRGLGLNRPQDLKLNFVPRF